MLMSQQQHRLVQLDDVTRLALMITPTDFGDPIDQAREAISAIRSILGRQSVLMTLTKQTVFVRSADDIPTFQNLFKAIYRDRVPATSFVIQPPCGGQALAIEAWALGGEGIRVDFPLPDLVTVSYDGLRWIYVAGITSPPQASCASDESEDSFRRLAERLQHVDASFNDVCRIWLYQGGITELESRPSGEPIERYRELNRARAEFFQRLEAAGQINTTRDGHSFYPASTGIGMAGPGLTVSCLGLQTDRDDVSLHPLENPQQTSAFDYARKFSPQSPLFSRAMAVKIGDHVTTWISGTASILDSESVHLGDVAKQTEQTIDNIENLISGKNFERHGLPGLAAELTDLAKVRVYVKRPEDYETCRSICEARFGSVPAIYAVADVCRPELLVEIEGVAFSDVSPAS
ncbi:Endoribonuclease L-PSP [Stieleria neptunia]|uniref:Endoribonuclease L-PSP n=1 Tax=Stieleria neptunia TaxID=2527979 RepID=A0A518HLJ7_9BACT|nr:dioxygenase [Stieleria neptunia]QDV41678.1 Endoribonuclease L-PSP [Stieleria neptunia]